MEAIKEMFPEVKPQLLTDFRIAILNYQYHPVATMSEGLTISPNAAQRPYEPIDSDDMEFLRINHTDFYNTVNRVSYNNNPLTYSHSGCSTQEGSCGGEYNILEKCPKESRAWVPYQFMIGKVPVLYYKTIVEYLAQGTMYNIYFQICNSVLLHNFDLFLDGVGDTILKNAMGRREERAESALINSTLQLHIPKEPINGRRVMYFKAVVNQSQGTTEVALAPHPPM